MKKNKKLILLLSLLLVFTSVLTACTSTSNVKSSEDSKKTITMALWGTAKEISRAQTLVDIFMEKHPDIKVELVYKSWGSYWTWLTAQAAAKGLPDIYKVGYAYVDKYAKLGAMKPLDKLVGSSGFELSNFEPAVLKAHQVNGKQVSLPRDANTIVMYFNKDLFDKAGLDYPSKEMSWDQVLKLAQKLTIDRNGNNALSPSFNPKKIKQWGLTVSAAGTADTVLEPQLWSNGTRLLDENDDLKLGAPKAMEVLNFFKNLSVKYHVSPLAKQMTKVGGNPFLALASNKVAMSFGGSWNVPTLKEAGINFGIFLPPKFDEVKTVVQPAGYAMSAYTEKEKAAWKLLSWLCGPEGQKEMAKRGFAIPANKKAYESYLGSGESDFNKQIFFDAISKSISAPFFKGKAKLLWEYIPQKLERPLNGKGSIEKAVQEISNLWKMDH